MNDAVLCSPIAPATGGSVSVYATCAAGASLAINGAVPTQGTGTISVTSDFCAVTTSIALSAVDGTITVKGNGVTIGGVVSTTSPGTTTAHCIIDSLVTAATGDIVISGDVTCGDIDIGISATTAPIDITIDTGMFSVRMPNKRSVGYWSRCGPG